MYIYPAIDLYDGKAVRLYKGDYAQMTVYSENPAEVAKDFAAAGASHIHLVDLEGAKKGSPANLETILYLVSSTYRPLYLCSTNMSCFNVKAFPYDSPSYTTSLIKDKSLA